MNDLAERQNNAAKKVDAIGAVSDVKSKKIYALADAINCLPGCAPLPVSHDFHAGVYMRTSLLQAGQISCGARLKIPTGLIVSGHCRILDGESVVEVDGYQIFKGAQGRQAVVYAIGDTYLTCLWATKAKTQREAELEAVGEEQISFLVEK